MKTDQKPFIAAGIDLGAARTRCVLGRMDGPRLHFIGAGTVESAGWEKSRIVDQQAVSRCVLQAVQQAEDMAGVQIESITAGFGGLTVRGSSLRSDKAIFPRPKEIAQADVNRVMKTVLRRAVAEDRMVLQLVPQDFVLDDHPGHRDPRKALASVLEANAHVIMVSTMEHNAVVGAINQSHLRVDETVFEGFAACYAEGAPENRPDGVAVLDIGAQSTELVVYFGNALQLASTIGLSGDHFTNDIAHLLRTGFDDAQDIKEQFGSVIPESTTEKCLIELPTREGQGPRDASRWKINQALQARAHHLFALVERELARVGMEHALTGGLALTGGGSLLHGLVEMAEHELHCPVWRGLPKGIMDWPEELNDPAWATAAGLTKYAARLRTRVDLERQSVGLLGRMLR
jgi:cell division protein FtsA